MARRVGDARVIPTALAELRARLRDPAYVFVLLVAVAATALLVPRPTDPYATLTIDGARVALTAAAAGTQAGVVFGVLASLIGVFCFNGGFQRDRRARLDEVLGALPLGPLQLVAGRLLAVIALAAIIDLLAVVILGGTMLARTGLAQASPRLAIDFIVLSLPPLLASAGAAVALELLYRRAMLPFVASAIGLWLAALVVGRFGPVDLFGISSIEREASAALGHPVAVSAGIVVAPAGRIIAWDGLAPSAQTLGAAAVALLVALAAGCAALALARRVRPGDAAAFADVPGAHAGAADFSRIAVLAAPRPARLLGRILLDCAFHVRTHRLAAAGALLVAVAGAFVPDGAVRAVAAAALLFPLLWSRSFDADANDEVRALVRLASEGPARDVAGRFGALALLGALPLAGLVLHLAPAHPLAAALLIGASLLETAWLLFAAEVWRSPIPGVALVAFAWYVAVMNVVPAPVDFAGLSDPRITTFIGDVLAAGALVAAALAAARRTAYAR